MSYGTKRVVPEKGQDMLFAVAYFPENKEPFITDGPYTKVGSARGMVTRNNKRWKRPNDKGEYKLVVTAVDWVIVDE